MFQRDVKYSIVSQRCVKQFKSIKTRIWVCVTKIFYTIRSVYHYSCCSLINFQICKNFCFTRIFKSICLTYFWFSLTEIYLWPVSNKDPIRHKNTNIQFTGNHGPYKKFYSIFFPAKSELRGLYSWCLFFCFMFGSLRIFNPVSFTLTLFWLFILNSLNPVCVAD